MGPKKPDNNYRNHIKLHSLHLQIVKYYIEMASHYFQPPSSFVQFCMYDLA